MLILGREGSPSLNSTLILSWTSELEVFVCWLEMTFGIQVHSCDEASAKSEDHQLVRHQLVAIVSLDKSTTCYFKCHQLLELLLIFSSCYIVRSRHTGLQKVSDSFYTMVLGWQLIVSSNVFPFNRSWQQRFKMLDFLQERRRNIWELFHITFCLISCRLCQA